MGLSFSKTRSTENLRYEEMASVTPVLADSGTPASSSRRALAAGGVLAGLPRKSANMSRKIVPQSADTWSAVRAHIHNPGDDARVSKLIAMLQTLHRGSPSFRSRLQKVAMEGGVTITVADMNKMPHAFTHPGKRRIHLSAEIATDTQGHAARSLPALAVEISNLCRRDEFETVNNHFRNRRIGIAHAARLKEAAEYGSVSDMVRYFSEAREMLEQIGFGNPSQWYARVGAYGDVRAAYPTLNDYLRVAISSGHTAGYERQFSNIAAQMADRADSPVSSAERAAD
ncbi:hypothetical protein [Trinickia acidisoli]|uniref:hypothetical protein n=1 Tax=Trinickia acidisoli TaxID=2767482 RepID=UPI001A8E9249|nr:hypothetical protein [Trinickia acidisoli]